MAISGNANMESRVFRLTIQLLGNGSLLFVCGCAGGATNSGSGTAPSPINLTCDVRLSADQARHTVDEAGGTVTVPVSATTGCAWSIENRATEFVTLSGDSTRTGPGDVTLTVAENTRGERQGTVVVAGQQVTIVQQAARCVLEVSSDLSRAYPAAGGSGTIVVTQRKGADCNWSVADPPSWVTITSGSGGSGNGTVNFTVAPHSEASTRTATLTVAGQSVTISQAGASSCTFALSRTSLTFGASGGTQTVTLTVVQGTSCAWTVVGESSWLTATPRTGNGNGSVTLTAAANGGTARTETLVVAGQTLTASQGAQAQTAPTIDSQPQSQVVGLGTRATLSVNAAGTAPLAYQWHEGNSGDITNPISGATGSSYLTPALTNTRSYWVRVTNAVGAADSSAATITVRSVLNFDSISIGAGQATDATAYLASFGITFVSVSGGAAPRVYNVSGSSVTASSPPNVFAADPASTNTDESYDLVFSTPVNQVTFIRSAVASSTALPPWSVTAYSASSAVLSSVVRSSVQFPGPPAETITLTGPGIVRLRWTASNSAHVTYNHPPIDDLVLTR